MILSTGSHTQCDLKTAVTLMLLPQRFRFIFANIMYQPDLTMAACTTIEIYQTKELRSTSVKLPVNCLQYSIGLEAHSCEIKMRRLSVVGGRLLRATAHILIVASLTGKSSRRGTMMTVLSFAKDPITFKNV